MIQQRILLLLTVRFFEKWDNHVISQNDDLQYNMQLDREYCQISLHVENTLSRCLADKYRLIDKVFHAKKHAK